ncbi:AAA family ATPase [Microbacterium sp. GXF7504]
MRLHRIELTGFGPFRDRQCVDFDAFLGEGIFLIAGRTGAGKSSILDGVVFALYGGVPRYDGGEKRLRSDYCEPGDPTSVRLEFTVGERRWRVTRAPEYQRPAKRGGGLTPEPARAELEEDVDGVWVGRAARPRDVALLLDEIVGLNQTQFQQVILLAQNRFSRFLLAENKDRQALLRTLFDSRRFEQYREALEERRRQAQRRLEEAGAEVRTLVEVAERLIEDDLAASGVGADAPAEAPAPTTLAERIAAADQALQRAAYRADAAVQTRAQADEAHALAAAEHARLTALAKAQGELVRARETLAALEADAAAVAADTERLRAARAAETVRAVLAEVERAELAAAGAVMALETAQTTWMRTAEAPDDDPEAVAERLGGALAVWETARTQEQALPALTREADDAVRDVADAAAALAELQRLGAQIPDELTALDARIAETALAAGGIEAAREHHTRLQAQRAAAVEAETLAARAHDADRAYRTAAEASQTASGAVAALLRRRLDGYAGELAAALVPGEPCPVCGGAEHPHPAAGGADPVTDEQFAAAEAERDAAAAAEREAADAARQARDALAAAQARAGGRTVADLDADLAAAAEALQAADDAATERERLLSARADLVAQQDVVADSLTRLAVRQADAREREATARERLAAATTAVTEARGTHDTVADRIAAGTRVRDAAQALVTATRDAERAVDTLREARARADDALAATDFADAGAVRAALLDRAERERLDARIAAHLADTAATRQRLLDLELELAGTDDAAVDVDASAAALATADAVRSDAIAAEEGARSRVAALRDLLERIDAAHAAVAAQTAEAEAVTRLADTVAGRVPNTMKMDLETFVLAAELEEIVAAANLRLAEMSAGRYTLLHSDALASHGRASGLGIEVLDAHTGRTRPPQSLSGGETFLASLALALGLAEVVTARAGGIRLDTLFIDEGFGSLDAETLELAMRTLDQLRAGGRTVGVISHVEAMQEQIAAKVHVVAGTDGPSVVRQETAVAL